MPRYYHKIDKNEVLYDPTPLDPDPEGPLTPPPTPDVVDPNVVELPSNNVFWNQLAPNTHLTYDIDGIPDGTAITFTVGELLAQDESSWGNSELDVIKLRLEEHLDGYLASISTEANWRTYRNEVRDYIIQADTGDMGAEVRPVAPT